MIESLKKTFKVPLGFRWSALILPLLLIWQFGFIGVFYYLMLIFSLLIHEYAHVWMAISQSVPVKEVRIRVLGGAAMIRPQIDYRKEINMAVVGPFASFILAILSLFIMVFIPTNQFLGLFFLMNIAFCLFNLIPAYPMDGGRILNGILSKYIGYRRAVKISAIVAYIIAGFLCLFSALYGYIWLMFISVITIFMAYSNKQVVLRNLTEMGYDGK